MIYLNAVGPIHAHPSARGFVNLSRSSLFLLGHLDLTSGHLFELRAFAFAPEVAWVSFSFACS